MKILVCDDSMTVRKKLINSIKSIMDCQIIEAKNGEEGITKYFDEKPSLVFMDIIMPKKDGLLAVAEIVTQHPNASIIMLSSAGTKNNLQKALKFGAKDFIQKPVDQERLELILNTYKEARYV